MLRDLSPVTAEARRRLSRICFGLFLLFALALLGQALVYAIAAAIAPSITEAPIFVWAASLLPMYGLGLPVLYLTVRALPSAPPRKRRLRVRDFVIFLLISYAVMYLANLVGTAINLATDAILGHSSDAGAVEVIESSPLPYTILFAVVLAPLMEELLFRGIILRRLLPFGEGFAVFTSALLFGLYHGNLAQFLYAFAVGWIFAVVAVRTGKLIHTVLLHMLINLLGTVPPMLLMPYIEGQLAGFTGEGEMPSLSGEAVLALLALFGYLGFILLLVGGGIILLIIKRRALIPRPSAYPIPREEWRCLPISLGGGALLLMLIFLFVVSYL